MSLLLILEATLVFSLTSTGATNQVVIMERPEHHQLLTLDDAPPLPVVTYVATAPRTIRVPRAATIERAARRLLEHYQPLELTTVPTHAVRRRRGARRPPRRSWLRRQRA